MAGFRLPSSFRDPSGFLFLADGILYRQVNQGYQPDYDRLINSGLYQKLTEQSFLIGHEEVNRPELEPGTAYKVLKPAVVPFISYPYEWCFSQLKDAALTTLKIQKVALAHGLSLKDASAFNIQFIAGRPILVDTLSFERYREGRPWVAYRQFCQHFLAPLALMSYRDSRLNQLLRVFLDGIPLDLTSTLLPARTRLSPSLAAHIHFHAQSQKRFADKPERPPSRRLSRRSLETIVDSLTSAIQKMTWRPSGTEWGSYYQHTNYDEAAFTDKKEIVKKYLLKIKPQTVWDLGANTGIFSRISAALGSLTIAIDGDPAAVELNYHEMKRKKEKNILPLVVDLTNPSPALGWHNQERRSLFDRGPADVVMALALIHHLVLSNNTPLTSLADFFRSLGRRLIIEFVPKSDWQVQRLLATREDIFRDYAQSSFEAVFKKHYTLLESHKIQGSERILYIMALKQ